MEYFRVINFEKFQHYKDRSPPWIKLYNDILDDYEFSCLQDASKLHLILIYLLASRSNNKIPWDKAWIIKKIGTEKVDLEELQTFGFIEKLQSKQGKKRKQPASKPLASRKQNACLEERRGEREGEGENNIYNGLDFSAWPDMPSQQILSDWFAMRKRIKADVSQTVINNFSKQMTIAVSNGITVDDCLSECVTRNWRGFKYEWIQNASGRNDPSRQTGSNKQLSSCERSEAAIDSVFGTSESVIDADFERVV